MISDPALLAATIAGLTALAFWLDLRFRWARAVGATMLVIVFGAALSNLGLVPFTSPVYDVITGPVTSLSIVWLLFAVDVRDLRDAGPAILVAFAIALVGTATGAVTAALLFSGSFDGDAWKLAGVMTGTYAGGSLNFVAVGRELDFPPALFTAATASDNVLTALWFAVTLTVPRWLGRFFPPPRHDHHQSAGAARRSAVGAAPAAATEAAPGAAALAGGAGADHRQEDHPFLSTAPLRVLDLTLLMALGFLLLWLSGAVAAALPGIPSVLWLTTFALALGHTPPVRRLAGAMHLGSLGLHLFLVIIGIASRVAEILEVGAAVFWFTATVVLIHGVVTFGGARLAGLDIESTAVASQAAVGGPSSALALAVGRDWKALVLPGVVVGLLGYAVGNYLGLGVAYWMRGVLGG